MVLREKRGYIGKCKDDAIALEEAATKIELASILSVHGTTMNGAHIHANRAALGEAAVLRQIAIERRTWANKAASVQLQEPIYHL